MKIMIVGQGGREHAIAQALHEAPTATEIFAFPGSDGMAGIVERVSVDGLDELVAWMTGHGIDLCVAGEEKYLVAGLADKCRAAGIRAWGPLQAAAQLEGSKQFAKEFMVRHGVPTGGYTMVDKPEELRAAVTGYPCVLKFDGLAAGKGVAVCTGPDMVEAFIQTVFEEKKFGEGRVVVEEFLAGKEVSVICAVADGAYLFFTPARDYKRQLADDQGPNTGGMGAVASRVLLPPALLETVERDLLEPAVQGLVKDGLDYRGFLYFGLILTEDGPKVLEFNCRFGDPEAQAILPLVGGDLAQFLYAGAAGHIQPDLLAFDASWCIGVVLASVNYPSASSRGEVIHGLDLIEAHTRVYHAGTMRNEQGEFAVNGGRVLAVVCKGDTRQEARDRVYAQVPTITFDGAQYRPDIGRMHFE